jgi:hypothetical protein
MVLDEQLRQLADQVPAPPPGDPDAAFRRGLRRRRSRRVAGVAAAVGVVAVLGVGAASILEGPAQPDIADRPPTPAEQPEDDGTALPEDWPAIVAPPSLTLSGGDPFAWAVAVSPGEDGRWCVTAARGGSQVVDAIGEPCDQLLTPEQVGEPDAFGSGGSEVEAAPGGAPAQRLSWGFAPVGAEEVFVLFTDGTRVQAGVATGGDVPAPLWAIGYEGVEVQAVEARRGGEMIAGHIPAINVPGDAATATPEAVFGDSLQRQGVGAFTDEQRGLLDLRDSDELFWLPIEGTANRSVGIRERDGLVPLMFATDCGLLDQVELPDGWLGLCLEYTDAEQGRVRGLFSHGTTTDR